MLFEFISYLLEQIGEPYVWGGQHTTLTPENYISVIKKKEPKEANANRAIAYCEKKFSEGAMVLYAYDCSGLGMYWLQNVKKLYKSDLNANSLMHKCTELINTEPPEKGWWVFRLEGMRAVHIGYMVDDEYLVEAAGRDLGVVKTKWKEKDWDIWGIPQVFEDEIRIPSPDPSDKYVEVVGKSVNVRASDSTTKGKILFTTHKGDVFTLLDISESTGWYHIDTKKGDGYITSLPRYTKLI